jgi:3-methyladenine DNA glycosylase Mpg
LYFDVVVFLEGGMYKVINPMTYDKDLNKTVLLKARMPHWFINSIEKYLKTI